MNFLKKAVGNVNTENKFLLGLHGGFAVTLLYLALGNYFGFPFITQPKTSINQAMTEQVLAATTDMLTPTTTPAPIYHFKAVYLTRPVTISPTPAPFQHKIVYVYVTPSPTPQPTGSESQTHTSSQTATPSVATPQTTSSSQTAYTSINQLLNLINQSRALHGALAVSFSATISDCALSHSKTMANQNGLSHDLLTDACDNSYHAKAENVGMSTQIPDQAIITIHNSMMNEGPGGGHYDNIINPLYKVVGIGIYSGAGTTWITEDFEG